MLADEAQADGRVVAEDAGIAERQQDDGNAVHGAPIPGDWEPYRPPWYPNRDPRHNPFVSNGQTGAAENTLYGDWLRRLPPDELKRRIEESR